MPHHPSISSFKDILIRVKQKSSGYPFLRAIFEKAHGYPLNLEHPRTFCEWVNHKKITDRNPLLTLTSDKVLVRHYVREKLGTARAEKILIPQFWTGRSSSDIPFKTLPGEYFLKANHRSGANLLVNSQVLHTHITKTCQSWLNASYGQGMMEWAYKDIPRRLICEKVLRDSAGNLPMDFKFYCIHGQVEMIGIFYKKDGKSFAHYQDLHFNPLSGPLGSDILLEEAPDIPNYLQLVQVAEKLAEDFPLVRIDLYSFEDQIYFGEITHYPGSGLDRFLDPQLDLSLGMKISKNKSKVGA